MGFFGLGKKSSYLGVDLGSTSIKLVELRLQNGVPTLVTYGYAERAMGDIVQGNPEEVQKRAVDLLKKLYKESNVESYKAVTALPNFAVFNSVITLPVMPKKELAQAIIWEAKKFVPMPIEDVILDWKIMEEVSSKKYSPAPPEPLATEVNATTNDEQVAGSPSSLNKIDNRINNRQENILTKGKDKKLYRILLTAAARSLVKRYVEIFRLANLQLLALETEAFAVSRALIGRDEAVTMVIDISAVTTDIIVIERGMPVLNRSIDIGGVTLTRSIANVLNVDFKRAEQFKRDIGLSGTSKISSILEPVLKPVLEEAQYSLNLYQNQSGQMVEKVVISGGSAYLPNLADYFAKVLKMKVLLGDPWDRIAYPAELRPALEEIAPRFSAAVGLALRAIE